jgi:hypothetical protein
MSRALGQGGPATAQDHREGQRGSELHHPCARPKRRHLHPAPAVNGPGQSGPPDHAIAIPHPSQRVTRFYRFIVVSRHVASFPSAPPPARRESSPRVASCGWTSRRPGAIVSPRAMAEHTLQSVAFPTLDEAQISQFGRYRVPGIFPGRADPHCRGRRDCSSLVSRVRSRSSIPHTKPSYSHEGGFRRPHRPRVDSQRRGERRLRGVRGLAGCAARGAQSVPDPE